MHIGVILTVLRVLASLDLIMWEVGTVRDRNIRHILDKTGRKRPLFPPDLPISPKEAESGDSNRRSRN